MAYTQAETQQIAEKFAPLLILHPKDMNRPMAVTEYLQTVALKDNNNSAFSIDMPTLDNLVQYNAPNYYLKQLTEPASGNDSKSPTGSQIVNGYSPAPLYVKIQPLPNSEAGYPALIRIVYAVFYPLNGAQMSRATFSVLGAGARHRSFPLPPFARHEGDWEHITIVATDLNPSGSFDIGKVEGRSVWASQHSGFADIDFEAVQKTDDGRPILYSALNSHAHYFQAATTTLDNLISYVPLSGVGDAAVTYMKAVDVTDENGLIVYTGKDEPASLDPLNADSGSSLIYADYDADAKQWTQFAGKWGKWSLDNDYQADLPDLPYNGEGSIEEFIGGLLMAGAIFGFIPKKLVQGGAPTGPAVQKGGWWLNELAFNYPYPSTYVGGKLGVETDTRSALQGREFPRVIGGTIYSSKENSDQLTGFRLNYSDGSSFAMGGVGDSVSAFSLPPGSYIAKAILSTVAYDKDEIVNFLGFYDNGGALIAASSTTLPSEKDMIEVVAPDGMGIVAFTGYGMSMFEDFVSGIAFYSLPAERPYHSLEYGGPHGSGFSQYEFLADNDVPRITALTLRSGERVDALSVEFETGEVLTQGGDGGSPQTVEIPEGQVLAKIELTTTKYHRHTRISSAAFYTRDPSGTLTKILSGGHQNGTVYTIATATSEAIMGFYGRSGEEIDKLGALIGPVDLIAEGAAKPLLKKAS